MKKKKIVKMLNASIELCNIREQQIGELLHDVEIARKAHYSTLEGSSKEIEQLRVVLRKIATHELDDPLGAQTMKQWAAEVLR